MIINFKLFRINEMFHCFFFVNNFHQFYTFGDKATTFRIEPQNINSVRLFILTCIRLKDERNKMEMCIRRIILTK